jgi:hypothetical protein
MIAFVISLPFKLFLSRPQRFFIADYIIGQGFIRQTLCGFFGVKITPAVQAFTGDIPVAPPRPYIIILVAAVI